MSEKGAEKRECGRQCWIKTLGFPRHMNLRALRTLVTRLFPNQKLDEPSRHMLIASSG